MSVKQVISMKSRYGFIDPGAIMGVVVSLVILSVGVYAFFTVIGQTESQWTSLEGVSEPVAGSVQSSADNATWYAIQNSTGNISGTGNSVMNIVGIVLIIGAIMAIVGLVYNYVR